MAAAVRTEVMGSILLVTLDRAPANAINVATSLELFDAFRRAEEDPALRASVVTGAGERFFSAGWDLKAGAAGEAVDADHGPGGFAGLTEYFGRTKPVIAMVNGKAFGGGFELALAADLIVAAEGVEFALPEVRLGLVADAGGLLRLPERIPMAIAKELLLTGRPMSAEEGARVGLVNKVVTRRDLLTEALTLAEDIAAGGPLAIAAVLEVLEATRPALPDQYQQLRSGALKQYAAMLASDDAREGLLAFMEKRRAAWRGDDGRADDGP